MRNYAIKKSLLRIQYNSQRVKARHDLFGGAKPDSKKSQTEAKAQANQQQVANKLEKDAQNANIEAIRTKAIKMFNDGKYIHDKDNLIEGGTKEYILFEVMAKDKKWESKFRWWHKRSRDFFGDRCKRKSI